jgi:Homoserine dehydrogenase/Amino acid kinase family
MNMWDVIVLKFGSSVLRGADDLPDVVDEVYRHLREGKRVLAVVSAFEGVTDRLLAAAHAAFDRDAPEATAAYVATGESLPAGSIFVCGISARTGGANLHQLATVTRSGDTLDASVALEDLAADDFLAGACGAENRIEIELDDGRILRLNGRGAGRWPTATSVLGDVAEVWHEHCRQHRNLVTEISCADAPGRR